MKEKKSNDLEALYIGTYIIHIIIYNYINSCINCIIIGILLQVPVTRLYIFVVEYICYFIEIVLIKSC